VESKRDLKENNSSGRVHCIAGSAESVQSVSKGVSQVNSRIRSSSVVTHRSRSINRSVSVTASRNTSSFRSILNRSSDKYNEKRRQPRITTMTTDKKHDDHTCSKGRIKLPAISHVCGHSPFGREVYASAWSVLYIQQTCYLLQSRKSCLGQMMI
jgi:hypothetical protein